MERIFYNEIWEEASDNGQVVSCGKLSHVRKQMNVIRKF